MLLAGSLRTSTFLVIHIVLHLNFLEIVQALTSQAQYPCVCTIFVPILMSPRFIYQNLPVTFRVVRQMERLQVLDVLAFKLAVKTLPVRWQDIQNGGTKVPILYQTLV